MPPAIYALALAAFAIGTTEFIISGILPALSADLGVTIPTTGLLVTGYAIGVAIGGPVLAVAAARLPRKPLIVGLVWLFAAGQVLCALAPDYTLLMAARLVSAAAHGLFFGVGSVAAASLVPAEKRGAALAMVVSGITIANILGLPAGTAIGNAFGWRMSFWAIAAFGALAAVAVAIFLPADNRETQSRPGLMAQLRALRHQEVYAAYTIIILVMVGALSMLVYQVPALTDITGVAPDLIPFYLLAGGAGAVVGIFLAGRLADWKLMPALVGALVLQVVFNATLLYTIYDPVLVAINFFIVSGVSFGFGPPNQLRTLNAARAAPSMASTLISTAYNIGIAAGAFLGAMLLTAGWSYAHLPIVAVVTSSLAVVVALISWQLERRRAMAEAASA